MEDIRDKTRREVWDKNWHNLEYETFELIEGLWEEYLSNHLGNSIYGFRGFLMGPKTPIRINAYRVRFEIKTWLEVKYSIFQ